MKKYFSRETMYEIIILFLIFMLIKPYIPDWVSMILAIAVAIALPLYLFGLSKLITRQINSHETELSVKKEIDNKAKAEAKPKSIQNKLTWYVNSNFIKLTDISRDPVISVPSDISKKCCLIIGGDLFLGYLLLNYNQYNYAWKIGHYVVYFDAVEYWQYYEINPNYLSCNPIHLLDKKRSLYSSNIIDLKNTVIIEDIPIIESKTEPKYEIDITKDWVKTFDRLAKDPTILLLPENNSECYVQIGNSFYKATFISKISDDDYLGGWFQIDKFICGIDFVSKWIYVDECNFIVDYSTTMDKIPFNARNWHNEDITTDPFFKYVEMKIVPTTSQNYSELVEKRFTGSRNRKLWNWV